jgi:threonine-phosphate decarboxylase
MTIAHGGDLFAIARRRGWDWREVLDFSASINPLGPSPRVYDAIRGAMDRIAHYPEQRSERLERALAALWNVEPESILLGNGATELIHFLARVEERSDLVLVVPTFSEFLRVYSQARQVDWHEPGSWPERGMLVVTNPNNPLGAFHDLDPQRPMLVDESFIDFSGRESLAGRIHRHLVVLRSLTKFYALPGLRVGAVVAHPDRIRRWHELRPPWEVNVLAEEAALAAVSDAEHARRSREFVASERAWLSASLVGLPGLRPQPSCVNYLLVDCASSAAALCGFALERKVLLRRIGDRQVRIAVRTRPENERLLEVLGEALCA